MIPFVNQWLVLYKQKSFYPSEVWSVGGNTSFFSGKKVTCNVITEWISHHRVNDGYWKIACVNVFVYSCKAVVIYTRQIKQQNNLLFKFLFPNPYLLQCLVIAKCKRFQNNNFMLLKQSAQLFPYLLDYKSQDNKCWLVETLGFQIIFWLFDCIKMI